MPLGSLTLNRPFSKSLSVDFKRKESHKIVNENFFLVERIIKKKAFLPISKINRDFQEHERYLNRIRKMDSTNNKIKIRGLEKLSKEKLKQLPHINEISRSQTYRMNWKLTSKEQRSRSCYNSEKREKNGEIIKRIENTHFSNEFLEEKRDV
jgi:hypothetical protein